MKDVEAILSDVDKLQPAEKLRLLHELVDRMLVTPSRPIIDKTNFDKYVGIGKDVWQQDAQEYINENRNL